MSGNVWEWCLNEFENPQRKGMSGDAPRSVRGGSWFDLQVGARCGYRYHYVPDFRNFNLGFRVCCASPIF
jgi:formylglycine-generating enzyme required for sulfatase activity